jgi:hypothetical protein
LNLHLPVRGKTMRRSLLRNRNGTAEVIGSILFIIILLFFFTNVYLWHDAAVKDANNLYLKQANAQMDLKWDDHHVGWLNVTAQGSDVTLTRLWVVTTDGNHYYANLTGTNAQAPAGLLVQIDLTGLSFQKPDNSMASVSFSNVNLITLVNTLGVTTQIRK